MITGWPNHNWPLKLFLIKILFAVKVELVSKELNHFGVIADLFWQIGGHSSRFVLFCSFWRLFTIRMIKSVKVFPFSFWKMITFFFYFLKFKPPALTCKMAAKWFKSLDTNSRWNARKIQKTNFISMIILCCNICWFFCQL